MVRSADSESVKEELLKKLREKTGITYQSLERDLQNLPKEEEKPQVIVSESREASAGSLVTDKAARFVLAAKLFSAPYAKDFDIKSIDFAVEVHKIIAEYIAERETAGERLRPSELFEVLDEDCPEFNEILDLNYGDKLAGEVGEKFFTDSVKTLKKQDYERKNRTLERGVSRRTRRGETQSPCKRNLRARDEKQIFMLTPQKESKGFAPCGSARVKPS